MLNPTRLDRIATRQRKSVVRDALFAIGIAAAAMVTLTSLGTACHAATPTAHIAHR
jgi:hypothetical protein